MFVLFDMFRSGYALKMPVCSFIYRAFRFFQAHLLQEMKTLTIAVES